MEKLSIIIPVYNEEKTILKCIENIIQVCETNLKKLSKMDYEIIISNDGSTDNSIHLVKSYINKNNLNNKFLIINNEKNKGKGYAVKEGIKKSKGDYIIIQDADLEYNPHDYLNLLKKIKKHNLDFVYGSRIRGFLKYKNSYSTLSFLIGGIIISIITSILSLKLVTDEPTCYKLYKKDLKNFLILPKENGFEWEPAVTILLLKNKLEYGEVPIHYKARKIEEGKKIKWKDGIKAIYTLFKRRFKKIN